ncbi:MAG TPA: hypothetical protein VFB15_06645 [Candidatus Binataceae bacterium]|nr:hypothetical protein [Candidatus Binataceae bacterium]
MQEPTRAAESGISAVPQFDPIIVNRRRRPCGRAIKVVQFNARGGVKVEGIIRCLRRPPLAGADVIMLCEAAWRHPYSGYREFAREVADALEMSFVYLPQFKPREPRDPATSLGSALLCGQPFADVRGIPLPTRPLQPRVRRMIGGPAGLAARAMFGNKSIWLGVIHLNSRWTPAGRATQMAAFLAGCPSGPMVIGGDFNSTTLGLSGPGAFRKAALTFVREPRRLSNPVPWEPAFELLREAGFTLDQANVAGKRTFTFSRFLPPPLRPNLDWLMLRGMSAVNGSAKVVRAQPSLLSPRVSDHDFILCEVEL